MLSANSSAMRHLNSAIACAIFCITFCLMPSAFAQQGVGSGPALPSIPGGFPTPQTMILNFATQLPSLFRMVTAFAYVLGFWFVIHGIMLLKHAGEMRTQMSHEHHLSKPIAYIAAGTALIYIPSTVQVGLSTFWTNPNPYGYLQMQGQWFQFINVLFMIVQFVGVIAVIRGLIILKDFGGHGQQGGIGKGLTHIIGGLFCINIYQFVQVVFASFGLQSISQ